MSQHHYDKRLEDDLANIISRIGDVAQAIGKALENSFRALTERDKELAYQTALGDHPINRAVQEITELCHNFVARHLPSAGHLRFISSVLRLAIGLERIGDYAVTIAREAAQLVKPLESEVRAEAERIFNDSFTMFHQAIQSFRERDVELARETMGLAYKVDREYVSILEIIIDRDHNTDRSVKDLFGTLVVFNMLERVSDQAKNICEETVFAVTGQTKERKRLRILFLDRDNRCLSQMAAAIAGKAYPKSASYSSAGLKAAKAVDHRLVQFMEDRGYRLAQAKPRDLQGVSEIWSGFHVIVSLQGKVEDYISEIPFHTIALNWEPPAPPPDETPDDAAQHVFEAMFKQLATDIRSLIETMRGEEAG